MLSKREFYTAAQLKDTKERRVDGWDSMPTLSTPFSSIRADNAFEPIRTRYLFELKFGTAVDVTHTDDREAIRKRIADDLYEFLYGDILRKMRALSFDIAYQSRDEAMDTLKDIINKLEGE